MRGRPWINAVVLLGYCTISFLYFGLHIVSHPGRYLIGEGGQSDPEIFIWSFAWWPHAIADWTNPFFTHAIYVPNGINLMWTTSVPGLALAFSPVTILFGPDVSYNVAALVLPALSAWTAYLLCRYLTRSIWPALIGGYLFGFSSYMLGHQLAGHLNLSAVFLVPLVPLFLLRYLNRGLSRRGLAWRLGLLLAFQLSISTEVALTLTLALALAFVLAFCLIREVRTGLRASLKPIVAGYAIAGLLTAPLLVYVLQGFGRTSFAEPGFFSGDLLNLVVPTKLIALGGHSFASVSAHFRSNNDERGAYLGWPVLLIVLLYLVRERRSAKARFLLVSLVAFAFLTLGTALHVDGRRIVVLPWSYLSHQPLLNNVLPERFALYASLAAAVIVSLWTASTRGRVFAQPYVLPVLAVAALVPTLWLAYDMQRPERVAFFTDGSYKECIPRGETLAIFPFGRWGDSMLWQAETGFWFKMAEGNMGVNYLPAKFVADPTVHELQFLFIYANIRPTVAELQAFARSHDVDRVLSVVIHAYPNGSQMHAFGPLQVLGGMYVSPACGYTSLRGDKRQPPG